MVGLVFLCIILCAETYIFIVKTRFPALSNNYPRVIRFSLLVFFIMMLGVNAFSWGFRYYPIIVLYVCLIALNEWRIFRSQSKHKHTRRGIITLLFIATAFLPSVLFPLSQPLKPTGILTVKTTRLFFTDTSRIELYSDKGGARAFSARVWYPESTDELYPLILYSHGGISLDTSNESLFIELASHGYVVLSVAHDYHSIVTTNEHGKNRWINSGYLNELNREDAKKDPENSVALYHEWMQYRSADLVYIMDSLTQDNEVMARIDTTRIGVVGHSLGGSVALCMGRSQSRVKVVIALESPFMCDITGVDEGGFVFDETEYPTPVLNIYSDSAFAHLGSWPQYKANYRLLSTTNPSNHFLHIEGTHHFSLTDLSLTSPLLARILNGEKSSRDAQETLQIINSVSLEFLNNYLKQGE